MDWGAMEKKKFVWEGKQFLNTIAKDILHAVIFIAAFFDLKRQYVWVIWRSTQGLIAAVVIAFVASGKDPPEHESPVWGAMRFGSKGPWIERQIFYQCHSRI